MKSHLSKFIRNVSRNGMIRKIMPYMLQRKLWNLVLKNKYEKLRINIIKYFEKILLAMIKKGNHRFSAKP
jgi:hypothetical protein